MEGVIAVFIPIVSVLVTGLVLTTYFYFRSKEKLMMIDKGLSYEQMVELLRSKRDPFTLLKFGIIIAFFGLGLGIGFMFGNLFGEVIRFDGSVSYSDYSLREEWVWFWVIFMTGLGFVTSFFVTRKIKNASEKN
ncbi:MAG: hypothetical protein HYS25_00575 [Ignavibacteriales bacterium]|nr:hypothetical protein [Ignavibacteriales bacterium]